MGLCIFYMGFMSYTFDEMYVYLEKNVYLF